MKKLFFILILLLSIANSFGVSVIQGNPNAQLVEEPGVFDNVPWDLLIGFGVMGAIFVAIVCLLLWLIMWIYKKLTEERRAKTDASFYCFKLNLKQCKINSDKSMFRRIWWTFWIFRKKADVYTDTWHGQRYLGKYVGESAKKEGFYIMAVEQKVSFFKRETDIVFFPGKFYHDLLKRGNMKIEIRCEGFDEALSSEYFSIPILPQKDFTGETKAEFLDYTNEIMTKYFKQFVYRDVIRENIGEFRENVREATEMNSEIQFKRKSGSQLKE